MSVTACLRAALVLLVFSFVFGAVNAHACSATDQDVLTVGNTATDSACNYNTIQAAINAASCPIGTRIYITGELSYTAQELNITNKNVSLIARAPSAPCGGVFVECGIFNPCPTTPLATISGSGASTNAGVITIRGNSNVTLQYLTISGGTHYGSGGGIDYAGIGTLELKTSTVFNNTAYDGGGIRFQGNGGDAYLNLHANTFITGNTATATGGGIRAEGFAYVTIDEAQIWIESNEAQSGYGGGIAAIGGNAHVHIGSPGYKIANYVGVVYGNTAQYGGGLAGVADSSGGPRFDIIAADPNHPVRIEQNRADHTGGGLYLGAYSSTLGGGGNTFANLAGAQIDGNKAQEGSGIYADTDEAGNGTTDGGSVTFSAGNCTTGIECNTVSNNRAVDAADNSTAGSAILIQTSGELYAPTLIMRGNQGAHAIRVADSLAYSLQLYDCLLADNTVTGELVTFGNAGAAISQCTFAHNTIGGPSVLRSQADLSLTDSIFAQDTLTTLAHTGSGNLVIKYVLSGETDSLATGQFFLFADPSFVDPDHGDFHLLPNSLAIDFSPAGASTDRDLDNLPRDQDMPNVPNLYGDRDLGAYERQLRYCGASDTIFCSGFDNP